MVRQQQLGRGYSVCTMYYVVESDNWIGWLALPHWRWMRGKRLVPDSSTYGTTQPSPLPPAATNERLDVWSVRYCTALHCTVLHCAPYRLPYSTPTHAKKINKNKNQKNKEACLRIPWWGRARGLLSSLLPIRPCSFLSQPLMLDIQGP